MWRWKQSWEWRGHQPRIAGSRQELEGAKNGFSLGASRRTSGLPTSWFQVSSPDFRLLASRTVREWMSVVLIHQDCGNLLQLPQETSTLVSRQPWHKLPECPALYLRIKCLTERTRQRHSPTATLLVLPTGESRAPGVSEGETGVGCLRCNSQWAFPSFSCFIRLQGFLFIVILLCFGEKVESTEK